MKTLMTQYSCINSHNTLYTNRKEKEQMEKIFNCSKSAPVVETEQGKLRGYYFDGVYNFLGIPYAKAKRF